MKRNARWLTWGAAAAAYVLALVGAWGLGWAFGLDLQPALLLIATVAIVAVPGSAIPIARLVSARLNARCGAKQSKQ